MPKSEIIHHTADNFLSNIHWSASSCFIFAILNSFYLHHLVVQCSYSSLFLSFFFHLIAHYHSVSIHSLLLQGNKCDQVETLTYCAEWSQFAFNIFVKLWNLWNSTTVKTFECEMSARLFLFKLSSKGAKETAIHQTPVIWSDMWSGHHWTQQTVFFWR